MANWQFYFCNVNDKLSSIFVDTNLRSRLPDRERETLTWVWVRMQAPRPDGLSSNEEFQTLDDIEESLGRILAVACNALLAGRITGDGRREFYYYGAAPSDLPVLVARALSRWPAYRHQCGSKPDPEWRQYLDVLFPSAETRECIKNREVLEVLEKEGDQPHVIREVKHFVHFESEVEKRRFFEWVRDNGFAADESNEEDPMWVSVARAHSTRRDEVDDHVLRVFRAAKECGGLYDGWETSVEKADPPRE